MLPRARGDEPMLLILLLSHLLDDRGEVSLKYCKCRFRRNHLKARRCRRYYWQLELGDERLHQVCAVDLGVVPHYDGVGPPFFIVSAKRLRQHFQEVSKGILVIAPFDQGVVMPPSHCESAYQGNIRKGLLGEGPPLFSLSSVAVAPAVCLVET